MKSTTTPAVSLTVPALSYCVAVTEEMVKMAGMVAMDCQELRGHKDHRGNVVLLEDPRDLRDSRGPGGHLDHGGRLDQRGPGVEE